jgi:hypothetical protein
VSSKAFSAAIRSAAGYGVVVESERPVGDLGIGRGGTCVPRSRTSPDMSSLIRAARDLHRERLYDRADVYEAAGG